MSLTRSTGGRFMQRESYRGSAADVVTRFLFLVVGSGVHSKLRFGLQTRLVVTAQVVIQRAGPGVKIGLAQVLAVSY
jgi:hypothetical protein